MSSAVAMLHGDGVSTSNMRTTETVAPFSSSMGWSDDHHLPKKMPAENQGSPAGTGSAPISTGHDGPNSTADTIILRSLLEGIKGEDGKDTSSPAPRLSGPCTSRRHGVFQKWK